MSRVTLLGLPEDLGAQLSRVLREESHQVVRKSYISDLERAPAPVAVFISGDNPEFRRILALLRESYPDLPVIVVTRNGDTRNWLDALDAGAMDYCGAPFERTQLRWILGPALSRPPRRAKPRPGLPATPPGPLLATASPSH